MLRNCLGLFFIHLKLELLTQFPAPNDEKYFYLCKNIRLQNVVIRLTDHLPRNILATRIVSILSEICLKTLIFGSGSMRVKLLILPMPISAFLLSNKKN